MESQNGASFDAFTIINVYIKETEHAYTWCFYDCGILALIYTLNDDISKLGQDMHHCTYCYSDRFCRLSYYNSISMLTHSIVILFKFQLIGVIDYKFVLCINKLNIIKVIK
jgi:hypothetical protein